MSYLSDAGNNSATKHFERGSMSDGWRSGQHEGGLGQQQIIQNRAPQQAYPKCDSVSTDFEG